MSNRNAIPNALFLLAACCTWSRAAILTVAQDNGLCPNATYTTINAAITASGAGDEIDICPALYQEQLIIGHPLTLRGLSANGTNRVLLQPATMNNLVILPYQAVISVLNTHNVLIEGLVVDASNNSVTGCATTLAGIHFYNSSGTVRNNTIVGAQLSNPQSCASLFPGNGFGVEVDESAGQTGPFTVSVVGNTIHEFTRNGVFVDGAGITAEINGNSIAGVGPSAGYNQFGVFIALGAVGQVTRNTISQGNCGSVDFNDCVTLRSEGIVFRAVGDGSIANSNIIFNVQSGIFLNGANRAQITNNTIMNVDALDGIDIQGSASGYFTNSVISGNTIAHVFPITSFASVNESSCGINEYSGTGVAMNVLSDNTVTDAYCGIAFVSADQVFPGIYLNTLFATLNEDLYPNAFPPATEPTGTGNGQ